MDSKQTPPAGGGAKKAPTGIPTSSGIPRSSGIPAPSARRSAAANETSSAVEEEKTPKLQTSSSQKNLNKPQTQIPSSVVADSSSTAKTTGIPTLNTATNAGDNDVESLKSQVKDLSEKLETLKLKRAEDREKIREIDKLKIQNQQLNEFKIKAQEIISGLNKEIQQTKTEASSIKEQYELYKEEMNSHEQRIEELTVDKELAEAKLEELQEEITKLNERNQELTLELDVLKTEIELNGIPNVVSNVHNKQIEKENENLKAALLKFRDINISDKNEINRLKKESDELLTKQQKMQKENDQLKHDTSLYLIQINELKDQVTATLGSVQMIEQLTEQNLDLEEKIKELSDTIADLEAINEVNDQLLENEREEEKELRQSKDLSESKVREAERQIELLKYNMADQEKTILKFRELVKRLQDENDLVTRKLKSQLEEKEIEKADQNQSTTKRDFREIFIETQNLAIQIENELNRIELQSNRKYNSYLLSFFPDNFTKQSGENECLLSLLFFKRISAKCDLLIDHFKEKIRNEHSSHSNTTGDSNQSIAAMANAQVEFYYSITMYSTLIKLICDKFDYVLNNCEVKVFNNIGSMYYDFNLNEKSFEALFELLQKDQLDENFCFDNLEKTFVHFDTIFKNHLNSEKFDHLTYLDDFINCTMISSETTSVVLKRLGRLIEMKEDTEIILLFKALACTNDENKQCLKKLQRMLQREEKETNKIIVDLPNDLIAELDQTLINFFLILKTLKELYNLVSSQKIASSNDYGDITTAKQIEECVYQAFDKVYLKLKDDSGPYETLRNSTAQIKLTFERLSKSVENGEYEKKLTDEEFKIKKYQVYCPILKCSDDYKNTLVEAESIKFKLESKEEEIKELKRNLKIKVDELSEQKVRISLIEKKSETQTKELEEKNRMLSQCITDLKEEISKKEKEYSYAMEQHQQEIVNLESQHRDLKEKLRNTTKKAIFDTLVNRRDNLESSPTDTNRLSISNNNSSIETYPYIYEINLVRSVNRVLQKNILEANKQYAKGLCNKLPYLPNFEKLQIKAEETTALTNLAKQSNDLMKDVYNSFGNFKIENLRNKSKKTSSQTTNESKQNNISILMLKSKISNLDSTLSELKHKSKNGSALVSGDLEKRRLIAEISLPQRDNADSVIRSIDMNLNLEDIKQLLRKI